MEIIGIGIDIIEVDRIRNAIKKQRAFLDRIYTQREIRLSDRGRFRFEELAGRFAAKEAVLKALKTGWRKGIRFNEITILNEPSGAPFVTLTGKARTIADSLNVAHIHISISHTRDVAIGMAIATKQD